MAEWLRRWIQVPLQQCAWVRSPLYAFFIIHSPTPPLPIISSFYNISMQSKIAVGHDNQKHLNAYLQYCNLVGDNGGKMMSEKQYEEYKKNYHKLAQNRVYSNWTNPNGLECKVVGPSTKCFCDHYFKNHDFLEAKDDKIKCKQSGCGCANFAYIPIYGSQDFKCNCKHSYSVHQLNKKNCKSCACKQFVSTWKCPCGFKFNEHKNITQRRQEREKEGKASHTINGGIVSYSSMLDGVDRFQSDVKEYLKQNPDKAIKVQEMKKTKDIKEEAGEVTAYDLYNTPLKKW